MPARRIADRRRTAPWARRCRRGSRRSSRGAPRTSRSAPGSRARCWSRWCRAAAARGVCRHSRRPRRRATRRRVQWAPVPASATSPPTMKLGARPASARISMSIDVVVVLPCVPATATDRARAQIAASISARRSVGMPCSRAARSSMFVTGIGGRGGHRVASGDCVGVMTDRHGDAGRPDPVEDRLLAYVAAGHGVAHLGKHDGDRRHPRPADPDDVQAPGSTEVEGCLQLGRRHGDNGDTRLGGRTAARPATRHPVDDLDEGAAPVQFAGSPSVGHRGRRVAADRPAGRRPAPRAVPRSVSGRRTAAPWSESQRTFAVWWSSALAAHGTRIAGVPVTATSLTVDAPRARPADRRRRRRARCGRRTRRPGGGRRPPP